MQRARARANFVVHIYHTSFFMTTTTDARLGARKIERWARVTTWYVAQPAVTTHRAHTLLQFMI
jgi:hypothetical protein